MVGLPGAGGTSGTTKKAIGPLLCEVIEHGLLKYMPVLSEGHTLHFEITLTIYSENYVNRRIKKSEISNSSNLGLSILGSIHISALELIRGLVQEAFPPLHLKMWIKHSNSHPRACCKDEWECF